jgi:CRISPR-associated endonuclease/helicase Cas3
MDIVETFDEGFHALAGFKPLAWQRRLFLDVVASKVPEVIDLPTGLGKTSVMVI